MAKKHAAKSVIPKSFKFRPVVNNKLKQLVRQASKLEDRTVHEVEIVEALILNATIGNAGLAGQVKVEGGQAQSPEVSESHE